MHFILFIINNYRKYKTNLYKSGKIMKLNASVDLTGKLGGNLMSLNKDQGS